ncbi:MAG: hypothetical protein NZ521_10965, partial [Flammeovirgaceae bacterium]|nr:hypothetical protein [Flammeovirgaceae bacterium]
VLTETKVLKFRRVFSTQHHKDQYVPKALVSVISEGLEEIAEIVAVEEDVVPDKHKHLSENYFIAFI